MPIEHPRFVAPRTAKPDEKPAGVSAREAPSEYQSMLLRIIESTTNDPNQLRRIIYELARMNLRKETLRRASTMSPSEVQECMHALETAISRVEDDCSRAEHNDAQFPRFEAGLPRLENRSANASEPTSATPHDLDKPQDLDAPEAAGSVLVPMRRGEAASRSEVLPSERFAVRTEPLAPLAAEPAGGRAGQPQVEIVYPERENPEAARVRRRVWLWFIGWPVVQMIGPIVFCVVLYLVVAGHFSREGPQQLGASVRHGPPSAPPSAPSSAQPSGLPLPTAFGVYAVSNGTLVELEPLPIKAPDPRVALSAEINKPSRSILQDGKILIIVFRRDLVNSAPQKVQVRVVARVVRAVTLSVGKAVSNDLDSSWRIRGTSFDFKVSPLAEDREMIAIRPEDDDLVLPAGRYGVVLGGLAYDFTVDGPITASAQCLESFEALNGPVFSECRSK
jgi:hypothetical protein